LATKFQTPKQAPACPGVHQIGSNGSRQGKVSAKRQT
jgi:hypothetical protein